MGPRARCLHQAPASCTSLFCPAACVGAWGRAALLTFPRSRGARGAPPRAGVTSGGAVSGARGAHVGDAALTRPHRWSRVGRKGLWAGCRFLRTRQLVAAGCQIDLL